MIIFCWLCVVLGLQAVAGPQLAVLLVALPIVFDVSQRRHWRRLARRSRWLIILLALTFFLSTPGEALAPGLPGSWEGLNAAAQHGARFLLILAAVAWLLDANSRDELMAGLYCLSLPLRGLGWKTERAVARLALVFDYVDRDPEGKGWRALLEEHVAPEAHPIELDLPPFRLPDLAACTLAVGLVFFAIVA